MSRSARWLCGGAPSVRGLRRFILAPRIAPQTPPDAHRGECVRRRRYQKPRIKNVNGYWIAQYRDLAGRKRKVSLGPVKTTRKGEAEEKLSEILEPINAKRDEPSPQ